MNIVVTAGNTIVPIDRVRCLTNIFTGRTGAGLAVHAHDMGHAVTFLTSQPEIIKKMAPVNIATSKRWSMQRYRTFEDLYQLMSEQAQSAKTDAIIHCAAVSDYLTAGVFAPTPNTTFDARSGLWGSMDNELPRMVDRVAGKIKSTEPEMWLRLVRAPKLVDLIRSAWGFRGILVKFKLEADVTEAQLLEIAEKSRVQSEAELMVANTLEGSAEVAYLLRPGHAVEKVDRNDLPARMLAVVEEIAAEKKRG